MNRWVSLLREEPRRRTVHQEGTPESLGGTPKRLPLPSVLVIEERPEGFFLIRYSMSGEFAGDTWHRDLDNAMGQATFEFGDSVTDWAAIPLEELDPVAYIRRTLADPSIG